MTPYQCRRMAGGGVRVQKVRLRRRITRPRMRISTIRRSASRCAAMLTYQVAVDIAVDYFALTVSESTRGCGAGCQTSSSMGRPKDSGATPRDRWAAAGAKMSRP